MIEQQSEGAGWKHLKEEEVRGRLGTLLLPHRTGIDKRPP